VTPAALRGRVLRELVLAGALPRTTRWPPVLAGWLMAAGVLTWKADDVRDAGGAVTLLRVVAVLLATSVVALADDAAANQLAAAPVPLAWRYGVRCGVAALAVAIPWAGALLWVRPGDLAAALSLECATLTAVALAVAGGVARWSGARDASMAAGPAVFAAAILASVLPSSWALYATPGDGWAAAHLRWACVLAGALALLVPTVRDPAQRRWSRDRRRRHPHVLAETLDRSDAPRDPRQDGATRP
jgi:fluoroquinolone transport system permease protein